jgi:hypothetical protein
MRIVDRYAAPQWLHTQVEVPGGEEIRVDSDAFANNTWHRMRLIALTFGNNGPTALDDPSTGAPVSDGHPDWARRLLADVGISQNSDINLVSGSLVALCGNPRRQRQMIGAVNMGRTYRLPTPFKVPRDEGLSVRVEYIRDPYAERNDDPYGPGTTDELTFVAKGFFEDGYPGMLAGRADPIRVITETGAQFDQGASIEIVSSDLFNGGKRPLYLTELCFKEQDLIIWEEEGEEVWTCIGSGMAFAWLVNPTNPTATKWMPASQCIPTGLLTPQCRNYDGGSDGPLAYFFPPATYLDPKQAISVRLGNTAETAAKLRICLIGELEVC